MVDMIDAECLERFRHQIEQHRRYGWDIYQYSESPPEAVLAPGQSSKVGHLGRVTETTEMRRHRSWCCVWVDDIGEVRWQSTVAPSGESR
jgi:hypothetical protein